MTANVVTTRVVLCEIVAVHAVAPMGLISQSKDLPHFGHTGVWLSVAT